MNGGEDVDGDGQGNMEMMNPNDYIPIENGDNEMRDDNLPELARIDQPSEGCTSSQNQKTTSLFWFLLLMCLFIFKQTNSKTTSTFR